MIKSIRILLVSGFLVLIASCSTTDPATDGPSCSEPFGYVSQCFDSMATDAISNLAFQTSCSTLSGTYSSSGCNLSTYNVTGHCEYSVGAFGSTGFTVKTAVYYKSSLYANSTLAQAACTLAGGVWK